MNKFDTKVIFTTDINLLSHDEVSLIQNYWLIDLTYPEKPKFKFTLNELTQKTKLIKNVTALSQFVLKKSQVSADHDAFCCKSCATEYIATGRQDFLSQLKLNTWTCRECRTESVNKQLSPILDSIETEIEYPSTETSFFCIHNLNFIEKICLFGLLTDFGVKQNVPVQITREELNLTGSNELDVEILTALYEKKAITIVKDSSQSKQQPEFEHPLIRQAYTLIKAEPNVVYGEFIDRFNRSLKKLKKPKPGIYFNLDKKFQNHFELSGALFEKLTNAKLSIEEFREIEKAIETNLLEKSWGLVNEVKRNHKIPIKTDNRLELILIKLMKNFTPEEAYNLMDYQANRSAGTILSNREGKYNKFNSFQENYIFAKDLESFIERTMLSDRKRYKTALPYSIQPSYLEVFLSGYVIKNHASWIALTGSEVISLCFDAMVSDSN